MPGGWVGKRRACVPAEGHTHWLLAEGMERGSTRQNILDDISMASDARNWINSIPKQKRRPLPFLLYEQYLSFFYSCDPPFCPSWGCPGVWAELTHGCQSACVSSSPSSSPRWGGTAGTAGPCSRRAQHRVSPPPRPSGSPVSAVLWPPAPANTVVYKGLRGMRRRRAKSGLVECNVADPDPNQPLGSGSESTTWIRIPIRSLEIFICCRKS